MSHFKRRGLESMTTTASRSTDDSDEQDSVETINCWRIYPASNNLFADEISPADSSILIRQDEETDEYLRGYVAHPKFGNGLQKATFRKSNLVGWKEETVVPEWPSDTSQQSIWTRLRQELTARLSSFASHETTSNRGDGDAQ